MYENEFPIREAGPAGRDQSPSPIPDKTFTGRVGFIYPFLDPKTRTVKVRVEMANPGLKLKPDMFVNALIKIAAGSNPGRAGRRR